MALDILLRKASKQRKRIFSTAKNMNQSKAQDRTTTSFTHTLKKGLIKELLAKLLCKYSHIYFNLFHRFCHYFSFLVIVYPHHLLSSVILLCTSVMLLHIYILRQFIV